MRQDLISYELVSRRPFKVKECTRGTGEACGAIFLTRNFEKLLHERLGPHSQEVLTRKRMIDAVKNFEGNLKLNFDRYDPDCGTEFEIPLPGAPDVPDVGLEEGYLKLTKYNRMTL
jgi:hypothetical protein